MDFFLIFHAVGEQLQQLKYIQTNYTNKKYNQRVGIHLGSSGPLQPLFAICTEENSAVSSNFISKQGNTASSHFVLLFQFTKKCANKSNELKSDFLDKSGKIRTELWRKVTNKGVNFTE